MQMDHANSSGGPQDTTQSMNRRGQRVPRLNLPDGDHDWKRHYALPTPLHSPSNIRQRSNHNISYTNSQRQHHQRQRQNDESHGLTLSWKERIRHFTWTWFCMSMATGQIANVLYKGEFILLMRHSETRTDAVCSCPYLGAALTLVFSAVALSWTLRSGLHRLSLQHRTFPFQCHHDLSAIQILPVNIHVLNASSDRESVHPSRSHQSGHDPDEYYRVRNYQWQDWSLAGGCHGRAVLDLLRACYVLYLWNLPRHVSHLLCASSTQR